MLRKILSMGFFLLIGGSVGWWGRDHWEEGVRLPESSAIEVVKAEPRQAPLLAGNVSLGSTSTFQLNKQLILSPQFIDLTALFKSGMEAQEVVKLDQELLAYASNLLAPKKLSDDVERQLMILSQIEAIQAQVLILLVKYYNFTVQYPLAIDVLYQLRRLSHFDEDYAELTQKIKKTAASEVQRLMHANQKDKVVSFYEHLLVMAPDNYELQMEFATFEYEQRHYENALKLLNVLIYHPELDEQALSLLQKTQRQLGRQLNDELLVSLDKRGEQYIVNAMINHHEPVKLMIDTGASMTILSPEVMRSLGVGERDIVRYVSFSTANGVINAPVIHLEELSILNYTLVDIQAGVLPSFPVNGIDGLLGMNFLSEFSFFIDQENATLLLTRSAAY